MFLISSLWRVALNIRLPQPNKSCPGEHSCRCSIIQQPISESLCGFCFSQLPAHRQVKVQCWNQRRVDIKQIHIVKHIFRQFRIESILDPKSGCNIRSKGFEVQFHIFRQSVSSILFLSDIRIYFLSPTLWKTGNPSLEIDREHNFDLSITWKKPTRISAMDMAVTDATTVCLTIPGKNVPSCILSLFLR